MIQVDGLCKRFGRFEALRDVSFAVPEGSAFALIGANGAGKTTCIKVLMNILEPTRGTATVLGVDSRRLSPGELNQIGYVSENQQMPARLTVAEFFDYLRRFYSAWDRGLETEIRRQLRLPPERKIGNLSHGMRMKMALACALPFRPKLLMLDEPFNGLDPLVRDEFMEGLLHQAGEMTILISSHELHEIDGVASHLAFLDEGRLLFVEPMDELNRRFREVHVTFEHEAARPRRAPQQWLHVETRGNVLSFVDTDFSEKLLAERIETVAGVPQRIETQPMALRSIFTALARAARDRTTENGIGPSWVEPDRQPQELKIG
jgi:ABC-2 type transport system ATP-binding protein